MGISKSFGEVFPGLKIFKGGLEALEVEELKPTEEEKFRTFMDESANSLEKVSPELARTFTESEKFFLGLATTAKGKFEKPFGGLLPGFAEIGISLIIPQDIHYAATTGTDHTCHTNYPANSWELSLTAGSPIYLLGDAEHFYKSNHEIGQRTMLGIMKDGIIEVGTTPALNQIKMETEKEKYLVQTVHPLVDQPIEEGYLIYRYNTAMNIPIYHDFGLKLSAMPTVDKTSEVRIIGVVIYEGRYRTDLTWR